MPKVKDLIKHLGDTFKEEDTIAYDIWQAEDILVRAKENHEKLTNEEVEKVLDRMDSQRDSTIGLSWDVVDLAIAAVVDERPVKYNHAYTIAFEVISDSEEGATIDEWFAALKERVKRMEDPEVRKEVFGCDVPYDTFPIEP